MKRVSMSTFVIFLAIALFTPEVTDLHVPEHEVNRSLSLPIPDPDESISYLHRGDTGLTDRQTYNRPGRNTVDPNARKPYCPSSHAHNPNNRPLLCYQCKGEARQKDSVCDNTLWHFARRTEQYNLRIRCSNNLGFYCAKVIQEKAGIRKTARGCLGRGPVRSLGGRLLPLTEGCVVYNQNGFITTSCLCKKDLCNSSPPLKLCKPGLLFALFALTVTNVLRKFN